jgi:ATP/ADP translocase/HEAT repeat protein
VTVTFIIQCHPEIQRNCPRFVGLYSIEGLSKQHQKAHRIDQLHMQTRLMNLLNIRPGEGRNVSLMLAHYFFMGAAMILAASASFALFFTAWDASALPYAYLGIAIIVSSITSLFLKISERTSLARFLIPCLLFILFGTVTFRFGLALVSSKWLLLALPIWSSVLLFLSVTAFWILAGNIFDIRQGKRIFGLMNAGSWLAYVVVGPFITPLVNTYGTKNLYTIVALCVSIAFLILLVILRVNPRTTSAPPVSISHPKAISMRILLQRRYIVLIFAFITIWHVAFFFLDNIFYEFAAHQFPNADVLAGFIGRFFAAAGLLGFITDVFLTGRIISRFGLRAGLLTTPTLTTLCIAALIITTTTNSSLIVIAFGFAAIGRFATDGLGFSLDQSSLAVLNQPLEERERARVQATTEGIIRPLATGLAGGLLLIFNTMLKFNETQLAYIYLILAIVWVTLAIALVRSYPGALKEALHKRRFGENGPGFVDLATYETLKNSLNSSHPDEVIYALKLLEQTNRESYLDNILQLIKSPHHQVRIHILQRVEQLYLVEALPAIKSQLKYESDPALREAATFALTSMRARYAHLIDATDPAMQRGALAGLLRGNHGEKFSQARSRLEALAGSQSVSKRKDAAQLIGESSNSALSDILLRLITDPDQTVQIAALHAAGKIKHGSLWRAVIEALDAVGTRSAAFSALVNGGETALAEITHGIMDATLRLQTRVRLVRACSKIKNPAAIRALKQLLEYPNTSLRSRVYIALHACGFVSEKGFAPQVEKQIQDEVDRAIWLLVCISDLKDSKGTELLTHALRHELKETHSRLFFLFSFLYDPMAVRWALKAIEHHDEKRHAYAIEAMDSILSRTHKAMFIPLLENHTEKEILKNMGVVHTHKSLPMEERITTMISSDHALQAPWLAATAIYTARQFGLQINEHLTRLMNLNEPIIIQPIQRMLTEPTMLSTFERVMLLKTIRLFATTPDEALAELAQHLEELEMRAGQTVVEKGSDGDSLYVIVRGRVAVLDGEHVVNELGERALFGELSLLDSEPRTATIHTLEDTTLLRLNQAAFYDLMADYVEVAMGTIQMLTRNLRARSTDVLELNRMLKQ